MAKSEPPQSGGTQQLLATLAGRSCPDCADGELERETYKGKQAVVCGQCGTPRVQVWTASRD